MESFIGAKVARGAERPKLRGRMTFFPASPVAPPTAPPVCTRERQE